MRYARRMRWFGGLAAIAAIIAACSTFDTTKDDSPPGTNDGGAADASAEGSVGSDAGDAGGDGGGKGGRTVAVLAKDQNGITDVAADESYVYWGVDVPGYIRRVKLDRSAKAEDLEPYGGAPTRIHVDGTFIVWGDQQTAAMGLYRDVLQGGNKVRFYGASVNDFAVADDGTIAILTASDGYVRRTGPDGGIVTPDLGPYATPLDVIAVGNEFVWTGSGEETVWRLPSDGGAPTIFAQPEPDCQRLAKNDEGVYWTRTTDALVRRRPASGGPAVDVATGQPSAYGLSADADGVYWLTTAGDVQKWTSTTNAVETIASGQPIQDDANRRFRTNGLVLTSRYVVWTTNTDVRRVEK